MGFGWSQGDASIGAGFQRIAMEQLDKAISIAETHAHAPARRIHEARRRCKKLRALLRLVRPDFRPYREENAHVRDAARHLAEARDASVLRQTLASLMEWAGSSAPEAEAVAADHDKELRVLARFGLEVRALRQRAETWPIGRIDRKTLLRGLHLNYDAARRSQAYARAHPSDTALHEWRKLAKYHWHQLGLLDHWASDVLASEADAAERLTEKLGLHHDLAMLAAELAVGTSVWGPALDHAFVADAVARRQAELEAEIGALGRQVFAETPKALRARFAAYLDDDAA